MYFDVEVVRRGLPLFTFQNRCKHGTVAHSSVFFVRCFILVLVFVWSTKSPEI